jgi:hypothetical protein
MKSNATAHTVKESKWKSKSNTSYETLVLMKTEFNSKVRGAGFRDDGKYR